MHTYKKFKYISKKDVTQMCQINPEIYHLLSNGNRYFRHNFSRVLKILRDSQKSAVVTADTKLSIYKVCER